MMLVVEGLYKKPKMDGWIDGQIDEWMDKQINKRTKISEQTNKKEQIIILSDGFSPIQYVGCVFFCCCCFKVISFFYV